MVERTNGRHRVSTNAEPEPFHHHRPDEDPGQPVDGYHAAAHGTGLAGTEGTIFGNSAGDAVYPRPCRCTPDNRLRVFPDLGRIMLHPSGPGEYLPILPIFKPAQPCLGFGLISISTRLFFSLPARVSFGAIGMVLPNPMAVTLLEGTPRVMI